MNMQSLQGVRLPDFIIGGAPKCGTTSLHFILAQSDRVGIPHDEIHFFDADDPVGHPDFVFAEKAGLRWYDPDPANVEKMSWYASRFSQFTGKAAIGEDSTIYLQSEVAAARIHQAIPGVRMIFMLRDPVARAYSQYWHLVTRGRASCSFETALTRHPSIILGSTYAPHLRRYFELFGRDQVRVGLFEDFLADRQAFVDGMTDFVGVPRLQVQDGEAWFNRTYYPRSHRFQHMLNRVSSRIVANQYRNHLAERSGFRERLRNKTHYYWFRYIHPVMLTSPKQPAMKEETRTYLQRHLSARNHGLSDLLGRDLSDVWRGFTQ